MHCQQDLIPWEGTISFIYMTTIFVKPQGVYWFTMNNFIPNTVRKSQQYLTINQQNKSSPQQKVHHHNYFYGNLTFNNNNNPFNGRENTSLEKSVRIFMRYHFLIMITLLLLRSLHCISRQVCMCLISWRGRNWQW